MKAHTRYITVLLSLIALMTLLGCAKNPENSCKTAATAFLKAVQNKNCRKAAELMHPATPLTGADPDWCTEVEVVSVDQIDVDVDVSGDQCTVSCYGSFLITGYEQGQFVIWLFEVDDEYLVRYYE